MLASPETQPIDSVLIVDDSAVQRSFGASLARELGVRQVYEAGNGREALVLLGTLSPAPQLMIVDLEMPTMDGPELLVHLRQCGFDIPIIVASSRELALVHSVQDMGSAMGLRIVGALQKPLTLATLGAILRSHVRPAAPAASIAQAEPVDPEALRAGMDRGEIVVYYHPQIEIDTGNVRGVEALARWQHPVLGLVLPDRFIPVAERHGMIHQLTFHVMTRALRQTAIWNAQGLDLSVAINLSPLLFDRADLLQEISTLQQLHGIPSDHIVLEVTETSLLRDLAVALAVLTRLRLRGFGLSLDDYGTGFSSLQQLARIPFTELKIDRTFVHGAHERESLQVMLHSALAMASKLGIESVAEGVESIEDWRLLQDYGCTLAQGWLLAKPMSSEQFPNWLKAHLGRKRELRPLAERRLNT